MSSPPFERLGERLRAARKARGLRLADVAAVSGYSTSFLSQIERDRATPSVGALRKVSDALGLPVSELLFEEDGGHGDVAATPRNGARVVRRDGRKSIRYPGSGALCDLMVPDLRGQLEVLWLEAPAGASSGEEGFAHEGEECVVVLSGRLQVRVDGEPHELSEGDAITFASRAEHMWTNPGPDPTTAIWISTPPTF